MRKKAAEALVQESDARDPGRARARVEVGREPRRIRILAVEGLAKSATVLKDQTTIETLGLGRRPRENGYVRSQAALALRGLNLIFDPYFRGSVLSA